MIVGLLQKQLLNIATFNSKARVMLRQQLFPKLNVENLRFDKKNVNL
jgi:hypothetical protein